jgi:hypothetical protein
LICRPRSGEFRPNVRRESSISCPCPTNTGFQKLTSGDSGHVFFLRDHRDLCVVPPGRAARSWALKPPVTPPDFADGLHIAQRTGIARRR